MLSRESRITLLTAKASIKYGSAIRETAQELEELIKLVAAVDPLPKRKAWPKQIIDHLFGVQEGICLSCDGPLSDEGKAPHLDHIVPWVQGGENASWNVQLLCARCNVAKSDECNPDDVIRALRWRLLNLRSPSIIGVA